MTLQDLNPLRRVSPEELMARELDDARRGLLEAQTARDYANSMVAYQEARIDRLRSMLESPTISQCLLHATSQL